MPAKDYHLVVGCFGTVYIARKKKTKDNVMSSDRIEVDVNHFYQLVHQFAEATIKKGFSELEIKNANGSLYLSIALPNPKEEKRKKMLRESSIATLELLQTFSPEERGEKCIPFMETLLSCVKELTK